MISAQKCFAEVTRLIWRSQRDSNPQYPVRGRMVYPLAYAILLLPLRLELRYTGMALTPADGGGSIWLERRDSNSRLPLYKNGTLTS